DGTLLDHMILMYGSGISNSNRHSGENLPLLLAGGGSGRLKSGRHVKYSDKPSIANLLVTIMDKMDVPVEKVGGSSGKLALETVAGVGRDSSFPVVRLLRACVRRRPSAPAGNRSRAILGSRSPARRHREESRRERGRRRWSDGAPL